jgi:26S proteasome regulatory subunit N7
MANTFGVSTSLIDQELSRFISANRLSCKIDKVGDVIRTGFIHERNAQYQEAIAKGDHLLNRIQKLSRVIYL